jgi:O-antigen/teichoic acid export membrane protein
MRPADADGPTDPHAKDRSLPRRTEQPAGAPGGLTGRALAGMFWTFSGTGVQVAVQLLAIMALGRLITPTEFGVMGAATVVIAFSQIVSQIGVGPALVQGRELTTTHVRVAATLSVALGLLLGALVYFGAPLIASFYRIPELVPVLRAMAFMFPLSGLNTVAKSLLTRALRFRLYMVLDAGSYILGYAGVAVFLAWRGYGIWALVIANLGQEALRTVAMYFATRHSLRPSLDLRTARSLLTFGVGHSMAQIGVLISQQGDNLVVGRWIGPAALGIYGRAYSLMVMPALAFGRIVNQVLFPVMSQVQDERHRLLPAYERGLAIVALLSLPVSAFLWVVAPEFIPIVLGPAWSEVVTPFRLFTISLLFRMSSKIGDACIKAAGDLYPWALLQFAYAALVVIGAIIGQRWGVGGVAICVSVAMGFDWLSVAYLSRKVTGLPWTRFVAVHAPAALMAIVTAGAALAGAHIGRSAHLGNLATLLLAGLAAAATVGTASWLRPEVFLGPHGMWVLRQGEGQLRRSSRGSAQARPEPEALASLGKGRPE